MATSRMQQLQKLASSIPGANQQITQGLQEAQATQMQAALGAAPVGAGPQVAQQLGAQQAQQMSAIAAKQQAQKQQQLQQTAEMGLQQRGLEQTQRLGERERGMSMTARKLENRLSQLSEDTKNELLDKQLIFDRDQANNARFNDRQLLDFALLKARDQEDFFKYQQMAQQANEKYMQVLKTQHKAITDALQRGYLAKDKRLDFESKKKIMAAKQALEDKIARKQKEAAKKQGMWTAAGSIAGAVGGAFIGGPAGAAAGASAGGAAGGAIGSQT